MIRKLVAVLQFVCLVFLGWLLIRVWQNPGGGLVPVRSTLNIAAGVFLLFVFLVAVCNYGRDNFPSHLAGEKTPVTVYALLALAAIVPFFPSLPAPFVFDDYVRLNVASTHNSFATVARDLFANHASQADGFFRPVGILSYWLIFQWAQRSAVAWHLHSLALHCANTLLLFVLLRRFAANAWTAGLGALIFAWHGAHVEAVCWTAALFDLLAVLFVLVTLIAVSWEECRLATAAAVGGAMLACLTKESAYCLPLLVGCLAFWQTGAVRQFMLKRCAWVACACIAVFFYRLWYLRGLGGYQTMNGTPMVLSGHLTSTGQALGLRLWSQLYLPLNRSVASEAWLWVGLLLLLAAVGCAVVLVRRLHSGRSSHICWSVAFVVCCALPVFPVLLIGWDLAGARVLYLPSVGFALICCALTPVFPGLRGADMTAAALLGSMALFQLAATAHNELAWMEESRIARKACVTVGATLRAETATHAYVGTLPRVRHGVMFLGNGFPECVAFVTGGEILTNRVSVGEPPQHAGEADLFFTWDEAAGRLVRQGKR